MNVRVKTFAMLGDITGRGEIEMTVPDGATMELVFRKLLTSYPPMERWKDHVRFAVNNEYAPSATVLHDADEIAIIPPVSGG